MLGFRGAAGCRTSAANRELLVIPGRTGVWFSHCGLIDTQASSRLRRAFVRTRSRSTTVGPTAVLHPQELPCYTHTQLATTGAELKGDPEPGEDLEDLAGMCGMCRIFPGTAAMLHSTLTIYHIITERKHTRSLASFRKKGSIQKAKHHNEPPCFETRRKARLGHHAT